MQMGTFCNCIFAGQRRAEAYDKLQVGVSGARASTGVSPACGPYSGGDAAPSSGTKVGCGRNDALAHVFVAGDKRHTLGFCAR